MIVGDVAATLRQWRWLVATVFLVTVGVSVLIPGEAGRYVSTGTYVIQADAADEDDRVRATGNLSDAPQISSTYAYVSESELIEARALNRAGATTQDGAELEVDASVVTGANLLRISVSSPDQDLAREAAVAIGDETIRFIAELDDLYDLSLLDPPTEPLAEDRSRSGPLAVGVSAIAGALLGLVAAHLAEWLRRRRLGPRPAANVGPGMRDESYTARRLLEEISRTKDSGVPFRFAVMKVMTRRRGGHSDGDEVAVPSQADLPKIEKAVARTLREHDHLGQLESVAPGTFAAILPGLSDEEAEQLDGRWKDATTKTLKRPYGDGVEVSVMSCCYGTDEFTGDPEAQNIFAELL